MGKEEWPKNRVSLMKTINSRRGKGFFTSSDIWQEHKENPEVVERESPALEPGQTVGKVLECLSDIRYSGVKRFGGDLYLIKN